MALGLSLNSENTVSELKGIKPGNRLYKRTTSDNGTVLGDACTKICGAKGESIVTDGSDEVLPKSVAVHEM